MNITEVKVHPVEQDKLKAYVTIVLDNCFLVSDIKVISGPAGLFVSMPSKKKKTGEFKDVAHPLNRETRQWMEERILTEYRVALTSTPARSDPAGTVSEEEPAESPVAPEVSK